MVFKLRGERGVQVISSQAVHRLKYCDFHVLNPISLIPRNSNATAEGKTLPKPPDGVSGTPAIGCFQEVRPRLKNDVFRVPSLSARIRTQTITTHHKTLSESADGVSDPFGNTQLKIITSLKLIRY